MGLIISLFLLIVIQLEGLNWFKIEKTKEAYNFLFAAAFFSPIIWSIKGLNGALKGFNKYHEVNIYDTVVQTLTLIGSITLAVLGFTAFWIFILQQALQIIKGGIYWHKLKQLYKVYFSGQTIRELISIFKYIFSYSFWVLVMRLSANLIHQFDKIIISNFLGVSTLPIYIGIVQLMNLVNKFNTQLKKSIIPIASEIFVGSSINRLNDVSYKITGTFILISSTMVCMVIFFSKPILLVMGKDNLIPYISVFQFGLIAYLIISSRTIIQTMQIGAGAIIKYLAFFSILRVFAFIGALLLGIKLYGLDGAIVSNPLSLILIFPVWLALVRYKANVSIKRFLKIAARGLYIPLLVILIYKVSVSILFIEGASSLFMEILYGIFFAGIISVIFWQRLDAKIKGFLLSKLNALPLKTP